MEHDEHDHEKEVSQEEYQMKALECELRCREEIDAMYEALVESIKASGKYGIDDTVTIFQSAQIMAEQTAKDIVYKAPLAGLLGKIYHSLLISIYDSRIADEGM